jgi:hypothetical protein
MALKQTFAKKIFGFDNELLSRGAYHKIIKISGDKEGINFVLSISNGENHLESKEYTFKPSVEDGSTNFIRQGYLYLKSLPEYENAEDC